MNDISFHSFMVLYFPTKIYVPFLTEEVVITTIRIILLNITSHPTTNTNQAHHSDMLVWPNNHTRQHVNAQMLKLSTHIYLFNIEIGLSNSFHFR
jgi:hypothetical protein